MPGRGGYRRGAGRKAVWQDQETQTIRVPVALKDQLLDIGKDLDQGHEFYDGRTCTELRAIVQRWEAACQDNDAPEWDNVRQLLSEIQSVLANKSVRAGRCRKFRHGQGDACHNSEHDLEN